MNQHTASQLPNDLDGCGWYGILPTPESCPPLDQNVSADVVVVGAGFAGLSAARRLLQQDAHLQVVVIDAQRIAWGAAGRNSGFMIDLPHELQSEDYVVGLAHAKTEIAQNREAIRFASEIADEFSLNDFFSPCGKIHGAVNNAGVRALANFSNELDLMEEPYERRSGAEMRDITGSEYYQEGLFTPGCVQLQPAGYIRGIASALRSRYAGLSLYENTPALEISSGDTPTVRTANGTISAAKVILTVNGHLSSFGWFQKQLMHVYTFASMTRELSASESQRLGGQDEWGLVPAHPMGSTLRRLRSNRIVVRNTFTYNPDKKTSSAQVASLSNRHVRSFARRFPAISDVPMEFRWGGHLCLARNSTQIFGEIAQSVFAACCHNGLGTTKGTLGGMLIADEVLGKTHPMIDELKAAAKPSRLLPEPLMSLGAKAYLSWQHFRAAKEL